MLSGDNRSFTLLFIRGVSAIEGADADRFLDGDALISTPHISLGISAGNFGLESHHRLERGGGVIGGLRGANAGVEETAQCEHVREALAAIEVHFFAVKIGVGRKRRGDGADRSNACDERIVDERAVLQAEARIVSWRFPMKPLVHAQGLIYGHVAIGVDSDLPAGKMRLARAFVEFLFSGNEQTEIVWSSLVRF